MPLLEAKPLRLQGMYPSRQLPVYVPPSWLLEGPGTLRLELRVSELIKGGNLTVLLNQAQVSSVPLPAPQREVLVSVPVPI